MSGSGKQLEWRPVSHPWLADGDVHVWKTSLTVSERDQSRCRELLSTDECGRADRFYFDRDRRRFIVARARMRMVLAAYVGGEPEMLTFSYGPHGKPALGGRHAGVLSFNLSHSSETALIAVAKNGHLGVDVEAVRRIDDRDTLAERFFSSSEARQLREVPYAARDRAFFTCWTRKEAYIKAVGDGLARPLDRFDVTFLDADEPQLTLHDHNGEPHPWVVYPLAPIAGYASALVSDRDQDVSCWDYCDEAQIIPTNAYGAGEHV